MRLVDPEVRGPHRGSRAVQNGPRQQRNLNGVFSGFVTSLMLLLIFDRT